MGISYSDYDQIMLETKPPFDEALSNLPEGDLKKDLSATMKNYVVPIAAAYGAMGQR
jgi:hypothetical protein